MANNIKKDARLTPLSWLYGVGVGIRNELFDLKILQSKKFGIPVIGVGNITVGGTGKTPHVEYLIRLLKDDCNLAVLSRGYLRKTKGFLIAGKDTPMEDIGDEAYQIKQKFPEVTVAVDEKRVDGIQRLLKSNNPPQVVLLDDSYQHRYVKPGLNILLVDSNRMIGEDTLLPAGRLREPASERDRADVIIITKCPTDMKPIDFRVLTKAIDAYPYQKLFFSSIVYEPLYRFSNPKEQRQEMKDLVTENTNILLLTGIATPEQMQEDLSHYTSKITSLSYGDHHDFQSDDISKINDTFANMPSPKVIITTEKDETRLKKVQGLSQEVMNNLYVQPIRMKIINDQETKFISLIEEYALKHARGKSQETSFDELRNRDERRETRDESSETIVSSEELGVRSDSSETIVRSEELGVGNTVGETAEVRDESKTDEKTKTISFTDF